MEQPFRPSLYAHELRRRWLLIAIPFAVAVLAAIIVSLIMPTRYTATTTLAAPNPQLIWRWDNSLTDYVDWRFDWRNEVMPLVATQQVAQRALDKVGDQLAEPMDAETLAQSAKVKRSGGSMFTISVSASNPQDATLLANALAASLPEADADLYAGSIDVYENALAAAKNEVAELDRNLNQFRNETGIGFNFSGDLAALGEDELFSNQSPGKQMIMLKNSYRSALQNAIDRADIVLQSAETGADADTLPVALLDLADLERRGLAFADAQALAASNPDELFAQLRDVRARMAADLAKLEADAIAAQAKHTEDLQVWESILRPRGPRIESMQTLERKRIELEVKHTIEGERVQIIDLATPPSKPSQPNWLLNLLLAAAGGLFGGLLLAVIAIYLSEPAPQSG